MPQPDQWMVLDGTLTQFASVLELAIPPILWRPWASAQGRYGYCVDGAYHYDATDLASHLTLAHARSIPAKGAFAGSIYPALKNLNSTAR